MIFVSLGTMDMPFERMAKAIDELAAITSEEIIVQTGHTQYNYKNVSKVFDFCTKDKMRCLLNDASLVILQGGWGAISEAMELKKRIIVMPRRDKIEHIHDQFQLVRKLDSIGCVIGVFDEQDLPLALDRANSHTFCQIEKGNAENIIRQKIEEWFRNDSV